MMAFNDIRWNWSQGLRFTVASMTSSTPSHKSGNQIGASLVDVRKLSPRLSTIDWAAASRSGIGDSSWYSFEVSPKVSLSGGPWLEDLHVSKFKPTDFQWNSDNS